MLMLRVSMAPAAVARLRFYRLHLKSCDASCGITGLHQNYLKKKKRPLAAKLEGIFLCPKESKENPG